MIKKLDEFAQNGDKSISGLTLTTGFPRQQKPFRQWMNYLFNWLAVKQNEVIDSVNALDLKVEPLLKPIRVGEIFVTTASYTAAEVEARHGYGTWQRFAEGKTLVGYSAQSGELDEYRIMGNEFGENTHTLTSAEMASHKHSQNEIFNKFAARASDVTAEYAGSAKTVTQADNVSAESNLMVSGQNTKAWTESTELSVGADEPHNNIQPSIVVAYWLRVA